MRNYANPPRASQSCRPVFFDGLIGESSAMQTLYELIRKISQSVSPVLILGETGTGKELVARSIHSNGPRRNEKFIPIDCSALTPSLIESELFGHVKGAFTGAQHAKLGLLQAADRGTIFLDEVGELPMLLQTKLLRALQEKEIRPVGSTVRLRINLRVIAATNRNLEEGIQAGVFRQDLYFRLNVIQIKLPPLRQRKADIPRLVDYFLGKLSDSTYTARAISNEALQRLIDYDWPGNIRELENVIHCAVALCAHTILRVEDLPTRFLCEAAQETPVNNDPLNLADLEQRAIFRAMERAHNDKTAAARQLGIGKTTLYRKLIRYAGNFKSA